MRTCCPIVELRQYALRPGEREVLIDIFDRELVESQEAVGMSLIGQFRDLDDPDRFVWLRGFPDMTSRTESLRVFYGGPVWKEHRDAANATMIDSDDVLLLRPARETSGFTLEDDDRPPPGESHEAEGLVVATLYHLDGPAGDDFVGLFERALAPVLEDSGAPILAYFVTESAANDFPALPVREGEHVFAWFSPFRDLAAYERHVVALDRSREWRGAVGEVLLPRLERPPEVLRLSPTARSLLRG
jgi:hypothetical protein